MQRRVPAFRPARVARPAAAILVVGLIALAVAACGGSGGSGSGQDAHALIQETFSSGHAIRSGVLTFSLKATPSGSSTFTTPVSLTIHGPFQSRGTGQVPASDFTITIAGLGRSGSLGVVSTGSAGYLKLAGTAYQLPAASFQRLGSSFSSVGAGGKGGITALGIDPMKWLKDPVLVGSDTVAGVDTTHVRAGVDVAALLASLNRVLAKAAGTTGSAAIPTSIPPATQERIAGEVKNAVVDLWTGKSDRRLRRLVVSLDVPVSGQIATLLGGLKSAAISLEIQYADLNRAQTIAAPSDVAPYSQFSARLRSIVAGALGGLGGGALGSLGTGLGSNGTGSAGNVTKYSECIHKAGGDVTKMQKCSALLSGG